MSRNVIVFANGKGGVGKTSLTANIGGMAALSGWKTLLVDLDPQGNLSDELGVFNDPRNDHGASLLQAAFAGTPPVPMTDVRPNLDLLPGGEETKNLRNLMVMNPVAANLTKLAVAIESLAADYDLILLDTPPATDPLVKAAFIAAHHLVLITKSDASSVRGIVHTSEVFADVVTNNLNPDLNVMGVVRFNMAPTHTARLRNASTRISGVLEGLPIPVFDTFIRTADKAADDVRDLGQLAYEYADAAEQAPAFYENLRTGAKPAQTFSTNAGSLADDYLHLWIEIRDRYLASIDTETAQVADATIDLDNQPEPAVQETA